MMTRKERNARVRGIVVIGVVGWLMVMAFLPSVSQAKSRVALSRTKKTYDMTGLWDKVKLKNVPSGAKIRWKSSDTKVVKVKSRITNGIWYQVCRIGKANLVAIYGGKKYTCRIRVVDSEPEDVGNGGSAGDPPVVSDNEGNDDNETSDQSGAGTPDEATQTPSDGETSIYNRKIADFQSQYITDGMSDYDMMIAICEYLTNEFDYQPYQPNFETMIETGGGDCMASRIGVFKLARLLGLRAFKCSRYEDHGLTMVRCGDQVYMTVTGFNVPRPRYYVVYEMTEEGLQNMKAKYNNCLSYLGFE